MPGGSVGREKRQAGETGHFEIWNDNLSCKMALSEKDNIFGHRKKTAHKGNSAWKLNTADKGGGTFIWL